MHLNARLTLNICGTGDNASECSYHPGYRETKQKNRREETGIRDVEIKMFPGRDRKQIGRYERMKTKRTRFLAMLMAVLMV